MASYKVPVLVLGLVALLVGQSSAGIHHLLQTCGQETGATLDDAQAFMNTGVATQGLKCGFGCVMKKLTMVNDDGTLKVDLLLSIAAADRMEVVKKCSSMPPGDICENAYLHFKCYLDNDPEHFKSLFTRLTTEY